MTDRVLIDSLSIETVIGIFDWERRVRQSLTLDVELHTDLSQAGITDRLTDTVDYKSLSNALRRRLESSRYRLVETLACDAAEICLEDARVSVAIVTVHKPGALRYARDVAVEVTRARATPPSRPPHRAFIGVGSNLDPIENVRRGLSLLHEEFGAIRVSPTYQTDPVGAPGTPDFLNLVVELRTDRTAADLCAWLHRLETECGRVRAADANTPRTLDLDLLLYDDLVSDVAPLLPHPQVATAAFVLVPLADLEPELVHPSLGETIGTIRNRLPVTPPGVRRFRDDVVY